jgi:hypothetical protein
LLRSDITGFVSLFVCGAAVLLAASAAYAATLRASADADGIHPLLREEGLY